MENLSTKKRLERVLVDMRGNPEYHPVDTNMTHTLLPEESIYVIYSRERLRHLAAECREGFTSKQSQAFLDLYRNELVDLLDTTVKDFIKKKVG